MNRLEMPEATARSQSRTKSRVVLLHTRCRKSYPPGYGSRQTHGFSRPCDATEHRVIAKFSFMSSYNA